MELVWKTAVAAASQVCEPRVLLVIVLASIYGVFAGAIPGLTATMAVALLVPITFFLGDVEAVAAIVACSTCSIFAGDLPATLIRIPGTPASAAYTADAYQMTRRGRHELALAVGLVFSVLGGFFGAIVLTAAAPQLARFATQFTSYEYFWLYVLGLTCAAIVNDESRWKGVLALLFGLLLSTVGLATDYSVPRLTGGIDDLISGINFIPALIGLFGVSEVLRIALYLDQEQSGHFALPPRDATTGRSDDGLADGYRGALQLVSRRPFNLLLSGTIGAFIGMLPGAGADIAAWISYAVSKRLSPRPEEYGHGSLEGMGDATGANNAALGGAWIPALVFGIPGDSVTAIAIGVLMMKNITPGPNIFDVAKNPKQATFVFSVYVVFLLANLLLIPIGWLSIRAATLLVRIPRRILMPAILLFCIVGSFAMNGSYFDIGIMLVMGLVGLGLERARIPLGAVVLGMILGEPMEHKFLQCLTKSSSLTAFAASPISLTLIVCIAGLWLAPLLMRAKSRMESK